MNFTDMNTPYAVWDVLLSIVTQKDVVKYLEIGTSWGGSLIHTLAAKHPKEITVIDTWGETDGGTGYGNSKHITTLLAALHYVGKTTILTGSSHALLPTLRGQTYDLILVDGDHTANGGLQDLRDCWPLLAPGGLMLFDDICNDSHTYLLDVFDRFTKECGGLLLYKTLAKVNGVGVLQK